MILGEVTPDREAIVSITVRGPGGQEIDVEGILDTGFTSCLALPPAIVATLGLLYDVSTAFELADGSTVSFDVFRGTVLWEGQPRSVSVLAADGGPLIGMSLLYGSRVTLDVLDGGAVTIVPLP